VGDQRQAPQGPYRTTVTGGGPGRIVPPDGRRTSRASVLAVPWARATPLLDCGAMNKAFEAAFAQPLAFIIAVAVAAILVGFMLRVALVPQSSYSGIAHAITGRNARWGFLLLIVVWAIAMGAVNFLSLSYLTIGGLAFIGLLVGLFLFMGFIWSVIGE